MANKSVMNPGFYHLGFSFDFPPYHNEEYRDENEIKQLRWKHAVMFNRRAYVGNVEMTSYDGSILRLTDSIFKSRTNKFDSFSKDRRIDVAVGDGEDITALAHFADMLLQFKQTTLHIINCSGASEFLEGTYKFKGVDKSTSVCTTAFGVAWANKHGCFFFDGRSVQDLLTKRSLRRISPSTWTSFSSTTIRAGFFPLENQVVFINDGGDWFLYDLVTQSLTKGTARVTNAVKTNLVSAWDGKLLLGSKDSSDDMDVHPLNAVAYQTSTLTSAYFEVITRELDTGSPSVEKKWKKVYVTYKNAGSSKLKIYYSGVQKGGELTWTEISQDATNGQFASTGSWSTTGFKINVNAYSMKIKIASATPGTTLVPYNFEINDITFIFRTKSVK
tara:strand:- start:2007 stop:3170 length:1164 start_codon:yes stop_codon:yes gene_type:complete